MSAECRELKRALEELVKQYLKLREKFEKRVDRDRWTKEESVKDDDVVAAILGGGPSTSSHKAYMHILDQVMSTENIILEPVLTMTFSEEDRRNVVLSHDAPLVDEGRKHES